MNLFRSNSKDYKAKLDIFAIIKTTHDDDNKTKHK